MSDEAEPKIIAVGELLGRAKRHLDCAALHADFALRAPVPRARRDDLFDVEQQIGLVIRLLGHSLEHISQVGLIEMRNGGAA